MEKLTAEEVIKKTSHIPSSVFEPEQRLWHEALADLPEGAQIIEFGTGHGRSASSIGLSCPQGKVWTCDPGHVYGETPEQYEIDTRKFISDAGADNVTFERISNLDKKWTTLVDAVNIDSDHSYEQTLEEIDKWAPLVKKGGYMFFHDYEHPRAPGVRQAIDEVIPSKHKFKLEKVVDAGPVHTAWFIKK
jgi:predicted O-methyltransferase YrrM